MKFIKYSLIILIAAIILNTGIVLASTTPSIHYLIPTLIRNKTQNTSTLTKNRGLNQGYKTVENHTTLTSPCPNCVISTTLDGPYTKEAITTTSKDKRKNFNDKSGFSGNYYITIKRSDKTVLNTRHSGEWYLNS